MCILLETVPPSLLCLCLARWVPVFFRGPINQSVISEGWSRRKITVKEHQKSLSWSIFIMPCFDLIKNKCRLFLQVLSTLKEATIKEDSGSLRKTHRKRTQGYFNNPRKGVAHIGIQNIATSPVSSMVWLVFLPIQHFPVFILPGTLPVRRGSRGKRCV